MTTQEILERLEHVRQAGAGWSARCPSHEDRQNSLSIGSGENGETLLHCFVGCAVDDICAALKIAKKDLFRENHNGPRPRAASDKKPKEDRPTFSGTDADVEDFRVNFAKSSEAQAYVERRGISLATATELRFGFTPSYRFQDGDDWTEQPAIVIPHYVAGKLVGIKFRTISGAKLFSQVIGSLIDGLYAAGQLTPSDDVLIVEGPDDCALAISHGFNCAAIVSASSKLTTADIKRLAEFKRLFLVGDQDVAGQKAMQSLQDKLPAEQVIRVRIPGFKDIGEMYGADPKNFQANLEHALRLARASRDFFELDDLFTEADIRAFLKDAQPYVVEKLIPSRAITMFFGPEKSGKTMLASYLGKCVSNGVKVFGDYATVKTPVLLLDLENNDADFENINQFLARVGPEPLRYRNRRTGCPKLNSPGLIRFCEKYKPLLIVDSLTKHSGTADPFKSNEMNVILEMLQTLCDAGATVILIHHATKADMEQYANSYVIAAAVNSAFAVISEDKPELNRLRLESKFSRGVPSATLHLIGMPAIRNSGHFAIADASETPIDRLVAFVKAIEASGRVCTAEMIKGRKGIRRNRSTDELNEAVAEGRLFWKKRGPVSTVPDDQKEANPFRTRDGYEAEQTIPFPSRVRTGTEGNSDDANDK